MKRSRFTEEQIIGAIKRREDTEKTENICRELGIHQATFYKWKSKFGGMDDSEVRNLRALEEENSKLKKLVAELSLDKLALQSVLEKMVRSRIRKEVACELQKDFGLSERRACVVFNISRTAKRYNAQDNDSEIRDLMRIILVEKPRYGCPRVHQMLRRKGILTNHKRTARIYLTDGLQLSKRPPKWKRRRPMAGVAQTFKTLSKVITGFCS